MTPAFAVSLCLVFLLAAEPPRASLPGAAGPGAAGPAERSPPGLRALTGSLDWLLLASGNEQGWHEPCGCAAVRAGGIARRAGLDALLAAVDPERPRLWVMAGGLAAADDGEPGWTRTEALLDWAAHQSVVALNLAGPELEAGLSRLIEAAAAREIPLVSSSLVEGEETGAPFLPRPVVIRQVPSGPKVGFIGLTAHRPDRTWSVAGRTLRTREPSMALESGLAEASRLGAEQVVVLAALPVAELEELSASAARRVSLFVGADGNHQLQGERWAYLGSRGRLVLEAGMGAGGPVLRYHVLDEKVPADEALLDRQRAASRRVNELRLEEARGRLLTRVSAERSQLGAAACRPCHVAEYLSWERHGHSKALESLVATSSDFDPGCLACHATGHGSRGGFVSPLETPELGGVGCESCHGPGAAHVASGGLTALPLRGLAGCTACHDEANSPGFDAEAAWRRIRHGRTPS